MQKEDKNCAKKGEVILQWKNTYRVIPSKFPPIHFFEDLVDPSLMEELFHIESLTNDRLREEVGNIFLVPEEDRVVGNGSSIVMAAFTHLSKERSNRFSDGTFGIYYAAKQLETAIRERAYHSQQFLSFTKEPPGALTMRVYQSGKIVKPVMDVRDKSCAHLYDPDNYLASQAFGKEVKNRCAWGMVYNSVRHRGGECVAILRPPAIQLPVIQTQHYHFEWDGIKITRAIEIGGNFFEF